MELDITPQQRKKLEDYLIKHPIDPKYDEESEYFDGNVPDEQLLARTAQRILEENPE